MSGTDFQSPFFPSPEEIARSQKERDQRAERAYLNDPGCHYATDVIIEALGVDRTRRNVLDVASVVLGYGDYRTKMYLAEMEALRAGKWGGR